MKNFSAAERSQNLNSFKEKEFDLLIIGGGITGAGAARDAASRGLTVALIEARDFASGTSSRSSKLIHGGIRYLENQEFKLVFEALNERTKLFEMAPHLVHPLRFMIPLYSDSRVGMFKMGLGMWLYDALSLFQTPEMHERLGAKATLKRTTVLRPHNLEGSYIYSDAYMDDDRLVHETLRSAHEEGALCANYVTAVGANFKLSAANAAKVTDGAPNTIESVECRDVLSGEEFRIKAKHVISSVGPWTDDLGEQLFSDWRKILRPTKGIHLTLPKNRLPLGQAIVMGAERSDRIVFAIPRHEMIIIGTTDTDFKGSPENVEVTPEDVQYLLNIVDHYFPAAQITAHDVIASYAGVRPLVHDGSATEGKTSREHVIMNDPRGITFVAGGKYTTYRLMAEQVVNAALEKFPFDRKMALRKPETTRPLNTMTSVEAYSQSQVMVETWARKFRRDSSDVQLLADRYGMEAGEILSRYPAHYTYLQLEAAQSIDKTMCLNLIDFYARRVPLFLSDRNHGLHNLDEISEIFQKFCGWNAQRTHDEKHNLSVYMAKELDWKKHV